MGRQGITNELFPPKERQLRADASRSFLFGNLLDLCVEHTEETQVSNTKCLSQLLAVEKQVRSRTDGEVTKIHRQLEKPELLSGLMKTYRAKDENDADRIPTEEKKVQITALDGIRECAKHYSEQWDLEASKDATNAMAVADFVLGGKVIREKVHATTFLYMERQLQNLQTLIAKIPILALDQHWTYDKSQNLHRSKPVETHRTKKTPKNWVKAPATVEHPAQVELFYEDVIVGYYITEHLSGALTVQDKKRILERIDETLKAVKEAREQANQAALVSMPIGELIFEYVLG